MKTRHQATPILVIILFFITSILISYTVVTAATQRTNSIPNYEANPNNSTQGGQALGDENSFIYVGVFVEPKPGATNVSLDTSIYV